MAGSARSTLSDWMIPTMSQLVDQPDPDPETVAVTATVLQLKRAAIGRLQALADVEIEIAGVAFVVRGIRVIKIGPRSRGVAAPRCRIAAGRLAEAVSLPPELTAAIGNVVLDEYDAMRRAAAPGAAGKGKGAVGAIIGPSAPNARQRPS
jgi:DNA-binding cell septation regulator SpoVG